MTQSIFKAYDIRGVYPTEVTLQVAESVAKAVLRSFPESEGEIVVAFDARHGSPDLAKKVNSSLEAEAKNLKKTISVRQIGLSSTPMFYFLVNHFNAIGGIMITASHNPKNYNGMKIVKARAEMVPGVDILKIITEYNLT
jgi:phosphomannomutase